jgi:hypothetical protein
MKKIKTFEDACSAANEDPNDPKFSTGTVDEIAFKKLKVITKALNPVGFKPDWNNSNQYKWTPWFYMNSPGFRFNGSICDVTGTGTTGGSRLCFASEEISNYAGKQFLSLYSDMMILKE